MPESDDERRARTADANERRATSRWPVEIGVLCDVDGARITALTSNLTCEGMFVETDEDVEEGLPIAITFVLALVSGGPHARGQTVRSAKRKDDVPGFAVQFDELDPEAAERIVERAEAHQAALTD